MLFLQTLLALAAATASQAATPPGFEPGSSEGLLVIYGQRVATEGSVLPRDDTQSVPRLAARKPLTGQNYLAIMIDLDIPTDNPPATNTLLHWMQPDLVPLGETQLNTTAQGAIAVYPVTNPTNAAAFASYNGPNPPARIPLSHRYTQILVDTSEADEAAFAVLREAAATRRGFNASRVLGDANLADKVVAGNFYNVTNAGPATTAPPASSSTGAPSGAPSGTAGTVGPTTVSSALAAGRTMVSGVVGVMAVGALFAGL